MRLAIAARSMKATLEAWGAGGNLFHRGAAKETDGPDLVVVVLHCDVRPPDLIACRDNPADIEIYAKAIALPGRTRAGMEWYRTLAADHATALEYKKHPLEIPVLGLGGTSASVHRWCRCSGSSHPCDERLDRAVQPLCRGRAAVAAALIEFLKAD